MKQNLLDFQDGVPTAIADEKAVKAIVKKSKGSAKDKNRGCEFCPLNKLPGLNKVKNLDKVTGRRIMVWTNNPGEKENRKKEQLVGTAGEFLWKEGESVGLHREDCDIQSVVRCWTVSVNELDQIEPREPKKEELHCCSIYNEEALAKNENHAKVHLVLGQVAAKQLLKGEYRKDKKTFFSKKLNAWVIVTYHPGSFSRGGPSTKLDEFREALRATVTKASQVAGEFGFINKQDYKSVKADDLDKEIREPIMSLKGTGKRVAIDIEDDTDPATGEFVVVYVGFCWQKGKSRGFFLNHPKVKQPKASVEKKVALLKEVMEDPEIKKVMHHGSSDGGKLKKKYNIKVRGYDHDTEYSEYLRYSGGRAFGLAAIADRRFRMFAGYKALLDQWRDPVTGNFSMLKIDPKVIVKYNGADCDLTKRIEVDNNGKFSYKLLQVYIRMGAVLERMEKRGPLFDSDYEAKKLQKWIPVQLDKLVKKLRKIVGNENFNPNAAKSDVASVVYDQLKLGKYVEDDKLRKKRSTKESVMELLSNYHPFCALELEYRRLAKKLSTYMVAFRLSAQKHGGRLRTKWWLTGAITGRLRSGGEKNEKGKKLQGIVNFQNIHGDATIECMLVSDLGWRQVYDEWLELTDGGNKGRAAQA